MTGQQDRSRPVTGRRDRRALARPMAWVALTGLVLTVLSSLPARAGTVSAVVRPRRQRMAPSWGPAGSVRSPFL